MKEIISPARNWIYSGFGALGSLGQNCAICELFHNVITFMHDVIKE
jgi:hypothetical protein